MKIRFAIISAIKRTLSVRKEPYYTAICKESIAVDFNSPII